MENVALTILAIAVVVVMIQCVILLFTVKFRKQALV
jgi:hypothetical protein